MMNQTELVRSVRTALLAGLAVSFTAPLFAAEGDAEETLKEVEVLGSRIKRSDTETASPVLIIDAATLERSGAATIGDVLQELPAIAGAATNPSVNNGGGDGRSTVSLRGLGEQRTLLLVNGRRLNYNDVNSIPIGLVNSVEILKDGASAIYGSDAIGGVVNFTLKNDYEGGEVSFDYGVSSEDDGERKGGRGSFGVAGERGNFMVHLNYSDQESVSAADRDYSKNALTLSSGAVTIGGSSRTTTGRYVVPRTYAASIGITGCPGLNPDGTPTANVSLTRKPGSAGAGVGDFRCFNGSTDLFNYQAVGNLQLTPQERAGMFFAGNFNVSDSISAFAEAWTQNTRSAYQIAPLPFDGRPSNDNIPISANNIYNPFGRTITDSRIRLNRVGNRRTEFKTDSKQLNAGVRGAIGETSWDWEVSGTYGKLDQDANVSGYLLTSALAQGLGPSFRDASGTPRCGTPAAVIQGCVPIDFFGNFFGDQPGAATASQAAQLAALNAIATATTNTNTTSLKVLDGVFRGDLFETSAGSAGGAIGFQFRRDSLTFTPDFLARLDSSFTCLISSEACTTGTTGQSEVKEIYGEIFVPLLSDVPYAERLNLTAGVRWSDYDIFGSTTNGKLGLEWKPISDLLVRATYAQVFRAPTITDLFGGTFNSSDTYSDPCLNYNPRNPNHVRACAGGSTSRDADTQLSAFYQSTVTVKPEEGDVFTLGFVYSPEYLQGASATLDFWDVNLDTTIGRYGSQQILDGCYNFGVLCNLYTRVTDGTREPERVFNPIANIGTTETNGVDIGLRYNFDTESFGNFRINVDSSYVDKYDTILVADGRQVVTRQRAGTFVSSSNGGEGNYSRWRSLGNLTWNLGDIEVSWNTRYVHRFSVGSDNPSQGYCADAAGRAFPCRLEFGANTYHNVAFAYNVEPFNTKFRFGIDNAFDKQPPIVYQNNGLNGNTDERTFDTVGRYFWISSSTKF